jgi:DNA-binding SARP family transcriptional activator/class 3 adenylate cyclase
VPRIETKPEDGLVSIRLLGPFRIFKGERPLAELPNKASALLAFLAMQSDRVPREKLAELLWPDRQQEQSRQSLRQAIYSIRGSLGDLAEKIIEMNRLTAAIRLSGVAADAVALTNSHGDDDINSLAGRARLYAGEFLAGFPSVSNPFDEWVLLERSRTTNTVANILQRLVALHVERRDLDAALGAAEQLVSLDPLREDSHRLLMEVYAKMGRRAEALRQYETCAQILRAELSVDPDAETRGLADRLRKAQQAQTPRIEVAAHQPRPSHPAAPASLKWHLEAGSEPAAANIEAAPLSLPMLQAERRQLTVMVCRVLNATELSVALDPEDVRSIMGVFRTRVDEAVRKFGGAIAQQHDDGIVAYFGHPHSHEDDAERAVRAALEAVQAPQNGVCAHSAKPETSAGIASGLVVIEDTPKALTQLASGAAPYLAAQLQSQAKAGEVIISEATRRLLGRFFQVEKGPAVHIKGAGVPANAYRILRDRAIESRFKALRAGNLIPFIGRDDELEVLHRRWRQAVSGEGRAVLLAGEPGIGKSRIIHRFDGELKGSKRARLFYYCSPLHTQSTLHPFKAGIERAARIRSNDSNGAKLKKIEHLWRAASPPGREKDYRVIADLLGVEEERQPGKAIALKNKAIILKVMLDFVVSLSQRRPVLAVVEDAHWMDPTSLELVERVISVISSHPILLLLSARSEFQPGWLADPAVTLVSLSRLPNRQSRDIIAGVTSGQRIPDEVCSQIVSQAGGVPLYIEELTRSIIESGTLSASTGGLSVSGTSTNLALPDSLQSSLVERLDRVSSAKKVAQIGAVIGVEFSYRLLQEVSQLEPGRLEAHIHDLVCAGLIYKRGGSSDAVYIFRHAMVRDAVYSTVLKSDRQHVHASIARALEDKFPRVAGSQPELVAHHLTEAQLFADAVSWWLKAGKLAGARWAGREAISHLKNGLRLLNSLTPNARRDQLEYKLQLTIWPNLIFHWGAATKDATAARERIMKLMPHDEPFYRLFYILSTDFLNHYFQGEAGKCKEAATKLLAVAQKERDPSGVCVAQAELAILSNFQGKFRQALDHSIQATGNCDKTKTSYFAQRLGWEPSIVAHCQKAIALICLGRPGDAQAATENAIGAAEALDHPAVTIYAYCYAGVFSAFLADDFAALHKHANRCIAMGKTSNVPQYMAWSFCLRAAAFAEEGNVEEARESFEKGKTLRAGLDYTGHGTITKLAGAKVYLRRGDLVQAQKLCDSALQQSAATNEKWVDAELWRMKGDLFRQPELFNIEAAEDCYRRGLAIARVQEASLFASKCRESLARLLEAGNC